MHYERWVGIGGDVGLWYRVAPTALGVQGSIGWGREHLEHERREIGERHENGRVPFAPFAYFVDIVFQTFTHQGEFGPTAISMP